MWTVSLTGMKSPSLLPIPFAMIMQTTMRRDDSTHIVMILVYKDP